MKRALSLLLTVLLLLTTFVLPIYATGTIVENDEPVADDVSVSAYSAILINMDTGEVLYEHDADEKNYPASTTKIMTALLCLKYGNPKDQITVSSDAFADLSTLASKGGLIVGETMTVHRALQALLVVSASEAANVIGEYISGDRKEFVNLMNEEAQELGCTNTHFVNCHGLPNSDHYTTARDLSKIATAAMQYKEFRDIVGSAETTMEKTNKHSKQVITSTNGLLPGSSYPNYWYDYAIGIKTGHTSVAGYCLVSAAKKDDLTLLCVIMGCGSRESSFAQSIRLYDWGFDNYDVLMYGKEPVEAPPEMVDEEDLVSISAEEDFAAEPVTEPPAAPEPTAKATPVPSMEPAPAETESQSHFSLSMLSMDELTGPLLPVFICFLFVALLVIILIIVVIIMIVTRKRR